MTALMRIEHTCCGGLGYEKDSRVAGKTLRQSREYRFKDRGKSRIGTGREVASQRRGTRQLCFEGGGLSCDTLSLVTGALEVATRALRLQFCGPKDQVPILCLELGKPTNQR